MADNLEMNLGSGGGKAATDEATHSGETAHVQLVRRVLVSGAEGAKVVRELLEQDAETAVTVAGTGLTTLATIDNPGHKWLLFQFDNATQNLDDFEVLAKGHASAQYIPITPPSWTSLEAGHPIKATGVYTTSTRAFIDGDLNTVDAAQDGFFIMDVRQFSSIQVRASAAADSASTTPRWTLSS